MASGKPMFKNNSLLGSRKPRACTHPHGCTYAQRACEMRTRTRKLIRRCSCVACSYIRPCASGHPMADAQTRWGIHGVPMDWKTCIASHRESESLLEARWSSSRADDARCESKLKPFKLEILAHAPDRVGLKHASACSRRLRPRP